MIRFPGNKSTLTAVAILAASAVCGFAPSIKPQSVRKEGAIAPESRALVRQAIEATGLILVGNSKPRGSAVVVRSDGIVATNWHVITNDRTNRSYDEILFSLSREGDPSSSQFRYRLTPVLINKEYDLALLRVDSDAAGTPIPKSFTFPMIEIGDSQKIKLLEDLFIIGFPEKGGSTVTVNQGVVEGKDILAKWIKTDARVIHGNSGGAAVNSEGKLIGIPTKVVADDQQIDKDGDGFPDEIRNYGAVGFLRPAHLITEMLNQLDNKPIKRESVPAAPKMVETAKLVIVRGVVKSEVGGKPVAGALVGLLPLGEANITETTLLTWGSTNAEGAFKLNKPVPPGQYTIKAKALSMQSYTRDVEIGPGTQVVIVEMKTSSDR
ncbi:MAG: trypsin-like peptidase domain-containing protein [Blastocatellia bacterium]